jgi:hypothetical protein
VAEDLDPVRLAERIRRALAGGPAPAGVALPAPGAAAAADALIEVIDATAGRGSPAPAATAGH